VVSEQAASGTRYGKWLAADAGSAWPPRAVPLLTAGLAGLSYAWALGQDPLEPYYAAAVRSMSMSWHDFFYGAFDPAGTMTLDKLPGAFWIQALAVRAFGVHTWVIVAPQAVEGVLTVLVLYRAVRRLADPAAGLAAAVIIAVSPATVALSRGNISDSLMILLLVLAADAVSGAIAGGSQARLVLAAVWVGLAFQAKMMAVLVAGTAAYAAGLAGTGSDVPGWLVPAVIAAGAAATATALGSLAVRRHLVRGGPRDRTPRRDPRAGHGFRHGGRPPPGRAGHAVRAGG
jgi:4-amino-4-deoxy-L-arabinose transferase-like glycosyltransferase